MTSIDSARSNDIKNAQLDDGDGAVETLEAGSTRDGPPRELQHCDTLIFPLQKSVVRQYVGDPASPTELILFYAYREIAFDDPAQFAFGEALAKQPQFVASEAMD
jgi:hypothetical protein